MADWSAAEAYARSFARLCAGAVHPLLDLIGAPTGVLLDVGTGPGTLALAAADRGWAVRTVEPEPAMRRLARAAGLDPVDAALPDLPFADGAFGAVAANLVVNHLADPRAGVAELGRVAATGAVVAVSIWGTSAGALSTLWPRVLAEAEVAPLPGLRLPPGLDFARTPDGLADLLVGAGLHDVRTSPAAFAVDLPRDDLWAAVEGGIGVIGTTWRAQSTEARERLRSAYEALVPGPLVHVPAEALLAAGRR